MREDQFQILHHEGYIEKKNYNKYLQKQNNTFPFKRQIKEELSE